MSNPLGGEIGYNIWNVSENGEKSINLGQVGHSASLDNAAAAEIRGTISEFDLTGQDMDIDYFQATASWWRPAFANKLDETPIAGRIDLSVILNPGDIAGVVVNVFDAYGSTVGFGLDFVFSSEARELFGEDNFKLLELADVDFARGINQYGPREDIEWTYPVIGGFMPNTFVAGVTGFKLNVSDGDFSALSYTMQWSFS
jgi:hypothetical protein